MTNESDKMAMNEAVEGTKAEFRIRPLPENKINKNVAKEMIHSFLNDELAGKVYSSNEKENEELSRHLASKLKMLLRTKIHPDYKLVVRVVLGQHRGAGIRVTARCLWDSANDSISNASFENDSLFCVATLFAVYSY